MILTIVMTHGDALETTLRHEPLWKKFCDELVYTGPTEDILRIQAAIEPYHPMGLAEHHGETAFRRLWSTLRWASALHGGWDMLQLHEYDSIAFGPAPALLPGEMAAIAYKQNKPEKFKGPSYLHYPHFYTPEALDRIVTALWKVPTPDKWYSDRAIGFAAQIGNVPVKNLRGKAFSKNTIASKHLDAALSARRSGATYFHGVKDAPTFEALNAAEASPTHALLPAALGGVPVDRSGADPDSRTP